MCQLPSITKMDNALNALTACESVFDCILCQSDHGLLASVVDDRWLLLLYG